MKEKTELVLNVLSKEKSLVFSFLSIFFGIISGAICYNSAYNKIATEIDSIFVSFNNILSSKSNAEIFASIIISGLIYYIILFVLGGSLFGKESAIIVTAVKFMAIGALISYFYEKHGLVGLEYTLLIFVPGKVLYIFASLFTTKSCFDASVKIRSGFSCSGETRDYFKIFSVKMLIILFLFLVSWLIDFLCIIVFSGLFEFDK